MPLFSPKIYQWFTKNTKVQSAKNIKIGQEN